MGVLSTALGPLPAYADELPAHKSPTENAEPAGQPSEAADVTADTPPASSSEEGAQRRAPTAQAEKAEPESTPYRPFEICDWCPPQRRAPTLDRCDASAGYAVDLCNPKRQECGPWWKPVTGDLRFEYRFRSTGDTTDHTAWQFANVRFGDQQAAG